jgi:hypothetical protein
MSTALAFGYTAVPIAYHLSGRSNVQAMSAAGQLLLSTSHIAKFIVVGIVWIY